MSIAEVIPGFAQQALRQYLSCVLAAAVMESPGALAAVAVAA
jgi:hypothetical protein